MPPYDLTPTTSLQNRFRRHLFKPTNTISERRGAIDFLSFSSRLKVYTTPPPQYRLHNIEEIQIFMHDDSEFRGMREDLKESKKTFSAVYCGAQFRRAQSHPPSTGQLSSDNYQVQVQRSPPPPTSDENRRHIEEKAGSGKGSFSSQQQPGCMVLLCLSQHSPVSLDLFSDLCEGVGEFLNND